MDIPDDRWWYDPPKKEEDNDDFLDQADEEYERDQDK